MSAHLSNFVCQACGLETRSVSRADRHEMNHEGHEVFEFFSASTPTTPPAASEDTDEREH